MTAVDGEEDHGDDDIQQPFEDSNWKPYINEELHIRQ